MRMSYPDENAEQPDWTATELRTAAFLEKERRRHEDRIARIDQRLEKLGRFGPDEFEDGEVLWFKKRFGGGSTEYTYAVVRCNGFWYTSGPKGGGEPRSWPALVEFLSEGVDAVYWANSYEQVF